MACQPPARPGGFEIDAALSAIQKCRKECAGSAAATERGLCAMRAEQEGIHGQTYRTALVADGVQTSPSAGEVIVSTDSKESGLWLWQGEAPPQPPPPHPKFRDWHILRRIIPAAGWAGWITLPVGLAIASFAVSMIPHQEKPASVDAPAVALSPAPPPAVALSSAAPPAVALSPAPPPAVAPPSVVVPPAESTVAQLDPVPVPSTSTSTSKIPVQTVKSSPQRKSSRTAKLARASHARRGPPVPMPGVLTPPQTWHGGGY
jgi:hypothetical protein